MTWIGTETQQVISEMKKLSFFSNTGLATGSSCVKTWDEAITLAQSDNWHSLCDHQRFLVTSSTDADEKWNDKIREIRIVIADFLQGACDRFSGVPSALAGRICDQMRSYLLGVCAEVESSSQHNVVFYRSLWKQILDGKFPCGWQGEYPNGALICY